MKILKKEVGAGAWELKCFYLLLVYFIIKSSFFALNIKEMVFPDEFSWFGLSEVFSRSFLPPVDSPESYFYGLVTHIPRLYFFLMGKLLGLNFLHIDDLIFLRFVNVFLGTITLVFAWKLICLVSKSTAVRLLFVTMLSNTLMFTFLFGGVSYDNLTNLLAVLTLYFFMRFTYREEVNDLLLCMIAMLAGLLTKMAMLPFAVGIMVACIGYFVWSKWRFFRLGNWFLGRNNVCGVAYLVVLLLFLGLAVNLYAGNWFRYGRLQPQMDQFVSLENALQSRIFARGYAVDKFKKGELDLIDAQRIALRIRPESDRNETLMWLRYIEINKRVVTPPTQVDRFTYSLLWGKKVLAKIYGIMAHKSMEKIGQRDFLPYLVVLLLAGLGIIFRLRKVFDSFFVVACLFLTTWYMLILSQLVNFNIYRYSGVVDMALQGRYIFPVLVPFYVVLAKALADLFVGQFRRLFVCSIAVFFIIGEFPWFLRHVTPDWYF